MRSTVPATHALSSDPQVFEFTAYPEHDLVSVARWQVELINGHQHRKLTGQFRYSTSTARKFWKTLKADGAKSFAWAD
jgi:hypothetical protein